MRKKLLVIPTLIVLILAASTVGQANKPYEYKPIPSEQFTPLAFPSIPLLTPSPSPFVPVIRDFKGIRIPKPVPVPPTPKPKVEPKATPKPKPQQPVLTGRSARGIATWYCNYDDPKYPHSVCHHSYPDGPGADMYAAAGPAIRIGNWRGRTVKVKDLGTGRVIYVKLVDWCACGGGHVIDLYRDAMSILGKTWGANVRVSW